MFEEIEGLVMGPLRIFSKEGVSLKRLTVGGKANFWRLKAIFDNTLDVSFDIQDSESALSVRFDNPTPLLSIVPEYIPRKNIFFTLHWIGCLVFSIWRIEVPFHVSFECT